MSKILNYTMLSWSGAIPAMANTITVRDRAGTDGYTFIRQGKRSPQFQITTVSGHTSIARARTRAADYELLIGRFVTLEDPAGRAYGKIMVLAVTARADRITFSTDGSTALVRATWTLQRGR